MDDRAIWVQPDRDAYLGWWNLNDRVEARRFTEEFIALYERASDDPELRLLNLVALTRRAIPKLTRLRTRGHDCAPLFPGEIAMSMTAEAQSIGGLEVRGRVTAEFREVLTDDAMAFVAELVERFQPALTSLLAERGAFQARMDAGELPDFLPETKAIREGDWKIAGIPDDLLDRRVEITGPVDRKMIINALNANVRVFMADFEDSLAPTWQNVVEGQINLRDANKRTIEFTNPDGKQYRLDPDPAVLIARVRGLHLAEKHVARPGRRTHRRLPVRLRPVFLSQLSDAARQ